MKKFFLYFAVVMFFSGNALYADFNQQYEAGIRSIYSKTSYRDSNYTKPYLLIMGSSENNMLKASYSRLIDYEVSDGNEEYEKIGINEFDLSEQYSFNKNINISGAFEIRQGDFNYREYDYLVGFTYEIYDFVYELEYNFSTLSYIYEYTDSTVDIERYLNDLNFNVEYLIDDQYSLLFDYTLSYIDSQYPSYHYKKHMGRIGLFYFFSDMILFSSGVNIGIDSEEYLSKGIDFALSSYSFYNTKFSLMCFFFYNESYSSEKKQAVVDGEVLSDYNSYYTSSINVNVAYTF